MTTTQASEAMQMAAKLGLTLEEWQRRILEGHELRSVPSRRRGTFTLVPPTYRR